MTFEEAVNLMEIQFNSYFLKLILLRGSYDDGQINCVLMKSAQVHQLAKHVFEVVEAFYRLESPIHNLPKGGILS